MKKISWHYVAFDGIFATMSLAVAMLQSTDAITALQKTNRTPWDSVNLIWFSSEIILALGFMVRSAVISAYKVIYSAQDESESMK